MDFNKIERLLAKYWECETSLEEEAALRKFFNGPDVPEHLAGYKPLFKYYEGEKKEGKLGDFFDEEVLRKISEVQKQEDSKPKKGKVIKLFYDISRVAAVIVVVVVAGYFIKEEYTEKEKEMKPYLTDTFEDPQAAFEETKRALKMISANFKRGREEARKVSVFNDAQQKAKDVESEL